MTSMREFAGKSLGAIALVGEDQAWEIQRLALETVGAVELQRRRFAAGNPAQFQGDERDVIVLSRVDRPTGEPLRLRDEMLFKQRFNVAASRARDQLWLVHSLDPARDLQPADLRRRLIEHVRDPSARRRAARPDGRLAPSPFERAVAEALAAAGFGVAPPREIGRYRVGLVVSDGRQHVAVECDGDRFLPPEQLDEDLARQAVLERAGWTFVRVRGTRFFRDPEGALAELVADLGALGLQRGARAVAPADTDTLGESVRRRAAEIMRQRGWLPLAAATPGAVQGAAAAATAASRPARKSRSANS
jgi:very-short-patch-repair endonuclease